MPSKLFLVGADVRCPHEIFAEPLRAFGRERFALKDLPINHSQRVIDEQEGFTDFEIRIRPSSDFKAYLMSKGQWLIVLSPSELAEEIIACHKESVAKYHQNSSE